MSAPGSMFEATIEFLAEIRVARGRTPRALGRARLEELARQLALLGPLVARLSTKAGRGHPDRAWLVCLGLAIDYAAKRADAPGMIPPAAIPPSDLGRADVVPLPPVEWRPRLARRTWAVQNRRINDLLMERATPATPPRPRRRPR